MSSMIHEKDDKEKKDMFKSIFSGLNKTLTTLADSLKH